MIHYHSLKEAEEVFKALSAPVRIEIMELISRNDHMSMSDLAETLGITNSAVSMHVSKLENAGLIKIQTTTGKRGIMKFVRPCHDRLVVEMARQIPEANCYQDEIDIGWYIGVDAHPTCGIATETKIIGEFDNPSVFSYPEHIGAGILWIGYGSVSYSLPNRLQAGQRLRELQLSFEISSECPEFNEDYPSDIHLSINGISIGKWISPGDFGGRMGIFSPLWWPEILNQYGLLKTIRITDHGTFMDGDFLLSNVCVGDLGIDYNSNIELTFAVPKDTPNCGGMTLFGKGFGDYNQSIRVKVYYD
ncbi:MAG: helix-turn-helix domain-containing protein [Lachnospiraceae bacterium]|nr:helix-turn-helix domain-containing protein [Lachnospiraceae bacterium]